LPRNYDALEMLRQASTMSQQIVSKKDPEYGWYAGASFEIADKMSLIDFVLKANFLPTSMIPILKLYRMRLDQQRKAFFASVGSTEVTKLGFILGLQGRRKSAGGPI
jgi:hypothetical protein